MLDIVFFVSFIVFLLSGTIGIPVVSHFKNKKGMGKYLDNISVYFRGDIELNHVGKKVRILIRNTFITSGLVCFFSFFLIHFFDL